MESDYTPDPRDDVAITTFTRVWVDSSRCDLHVRGDLDVASSPVLSRELQVLLDQELPSIGVDLSAVSFIDSSALSALVRAVERAKREGRRVQLLRASPTCMKVFSITGLDRAFGLC